MSALIIETRVPRCIGVATSFDKTTKFIKFAVRRLRISAMLRIAIHPICLNDALEFAYFLEKNVVCPANLSQVAED